MRLEGSGKSQTWVGYIITMSGEQRERVYSNRADRMAGRVFGNDRNGTVVMLLVQRGRKRLILFDVYCRC
jgi:hypothetical protein